MFWTRILFLFLICGLECMELRAPGLSRAPFRGRRSQSDLQSCPYPRLENGRVRMLQRSKFAKFACMPRYELVGNKYAFCRHGKWDVPMPVCVKPGCLIPMVANGTYDASRDGAWVLYLCYPGHKLVGSAVLYCDGRNWNASTPSCVAASAPPKLSCDFEESDLCGWTQDILHDFDWKRLNRGTPSSVLFTGPSYDHTFGKGGKGYYMYIESTGRMRNDTARFLSPIYDAKYSIDACFSFYYHMFGATTGGLKVYQVPDVFRYFLTDKREYLIFEKWGDQGDIWFNGVMPLKNYNASFQIIIEGIRGTSFTSDIAIDDVAIRQGENCSIPAATTTMASTTPRESYSCEGHCHEQHVGDISCSCAFPCYVYGTCCGDFFDLCLPNINGTSKNSQSDDMKFDLMPTPEELEPSVTSTETTEATTVKSAPTSTLVETVTSSTTSRPTPRPTSYKPIKTTTKLVPTTKKIPITTKKVIKTTAAAANTTITANASGAIQKQSKVTYTKPTEKTTFKTTTKIPLEYTTAAIRRGFTTHDVYHDMIEKSKVEKQMQAEGGTVLDPKSNKTVLEAPKKSSSVHIISIISGLCVCAAAVYIILLSRTSRGRELVARMRGRASSHQEVAYLTRDVDDMD